jgi:hypothetical protein
MNEAIRAAKREGTTGIEAAPASNVGLGDDAIASAAAAPSPTAIITTTTKRATDAYLPVLVILAHTRYTDIEKSKP